MPRFYFLAFNGLIILEISTGICQAQVGVPSTDPLLNRFGNTEAFSIPSTTRIHEVGFGIKIQNVLSQKCLGGTFFDTGRGGKPLTLSDAGSQAIWEDLRSPISLQLDTQTEKLKSIEAPQREAQGWTEDRNGQIILSAQPNTITPIAITKASVPCRSQFGN